MKLNSKLLFVLFLVSGLISCSNKKNSESLQLLPMPQEVVVDWSKKHQLKNGEIDADKISVKFISSFPEEEGYRLSVTPDSVIIEAVNDKGVFWAKQTLNQLILQAQNSNQYIPQVVITDWPAFRVRGFMHDVGRSFISVEELKKQISLLSQYKVNVFHWHLTENQGWRLESKRFPQLNDSNRKLLARLDWNISNKHRLALRYNYTKNLSWRSPNATSMDGGTRMSEARMSKASMSFANSMYSQDNLVHSFSFDLNSRLSDNISNQFLATFSKLDDIRGSNSAEFPFIDILKDNQSYMSLGYELFTWNNGVHNDVLNIKDELTYYLGNHKVVGGIAYEYKMADNAYMRNGTGYYRYTSLDDFLNGGTPEIVALTYGYSGATPLGQINTTEVSSFSDFTFTGITGEPLTFTDMFLGLYPGSIGEASTLAILIGAAILIITGIGSWKTMLSVFLGGTFTVLLLNVFAHNAYMEMPPMYHLLLGGFAFGAVFMATDPVTSARTEKGKWIYGFLIGLLAVTIRVFNPGYAEGMMLAILFMNAFAPLIDFYVVDANIKQRLKRVTNKA
jgi:hypothetical protein